MWHLAGIVHYFIMQVVKPLLITNLNRYAGNEKAFLVLLCIVGSVIMSWFSCRAFFDQEFSYVLAKFEGQNFKQASFSMER